MKRLRMRTSKSLLFVTLALTASTALAAPKKGKAPPPPAPAAGSGDAGEVEMDGDTKTKTGASGGSASAGAEIEMDDDANKPPSESRRGSRRVGCPAGDRHQTDRGGEDSVVLAGHRGRRSQAVSEGASHRVQPVRRDHDERQHHPALRGGRRARLLPHRRARDGVEGQYYEHVFQEPFDLVARQARRLPTVNQYNWSGRSTSTTCRSTASSRSSIIA